MIVKMHVPLASFTSLRCGGEAEKLVVCETPAEVEAALREAVGASGGEPLWFLGYGCNVLISDAGLPGTTVLVRGGEIRREGDALVADAGAWWDDVVARAISEELWGVELMSGIPGSVGGVVAGNAAAYGQAAGDRLVWADLLDATTGRVERVDAAALGFGYRASKLQAEDGRRLVLRAAVGLDRAGGALGYQSIIEAAERGGFDVETLAGRRAAVLATRGAAGSLWDFRDAVPASHTAGSFFRNPLVTVEQAEQVLAFDESGRSAETLRRMNAVHGGDARRVSASLVLLAAGFTRGQSWGAVRLNPQHVLKIENTGGATAQQIYVVAQEIMTTVKQRLDIDLEPEVRFLGEF